MAMKLTESQRALVVLMRGEKNSKARPIFKSKPHATLTGLIQKKLLCFKDGYYTLTDTGARLGHLISNTKAKLLKRESDTKRTGQEEHRILKESGYYERNWETG